MRQSATGKRVVKKRCACPRWLQRLGLCSIAAGLIAPLKLAAEPFIDRDWQYQEQYHEPREMSLTPVRMMDNETLFLAAEAQRDQAMDTHQRLLNNRWLIENEHNTYSGGAAVGKLLRMTLAEAWNNRAVDYLVRTEDEEPTSSFRDLNNYHLKVSDDTVKLSLRLSF